MNYKTLLSNCQILEIPSLRQDLAGETPGLSYLLSDNYYYFIIYTIFLRYHLPFLFIQIYIVGMQVIFPCNTKILGEELFLMAGKKTNGDKKPSAAPSNKGGHIFK
ncbi:MAG: hypothetical protein ACOXZ5_05435 [Syntrophomonadaceae bacterium]